MGFADELWDQFEEVVKKVATGKEFCASVANFMQKRAAIEKEYAKKLQGLIRTTEKEIGTLNEAWIRIKDETEIVACKHNEFAESIINDVAEPIARQTAEKKKKRQQCKDLGRKLIKDLTSAGRAEASAKSSYETSRRGQDDTKEKVEQAKMTNAQSPHIDKLTKKLKVEQKKSEQTDKKYKDSVKTLKSLQDKFYDVEMPKILADLESIETDRITCLKAALGRYVGFQKKLAPVIDEACKNMAKSVKRISVPADLQTFVKDKHSGAERPPRAEYEPYSTEAGKCVKATQDGQIPVSANSRVSRVVSRAGVTAKATKPAKGIGTCRALYDYTGADSNELSFKQGDIITILQKDISGWWQGELNGKIGVFPSIEWVEEVSPDGRPAPTRVRALYEYKAETEYELSISFGEILLVEAEEHGWYCGTNKEGKYGRFPSNYVEWIH